MWIDVAYTCCWVGLFNEIKLMKISCKYCMRVYVNNFNDVYAWNSVVLIL